MKGVVAYIDDTITGETKLIFDDAHSNDEGSPKKWEHEVLFTSNNYDSEKMKNMELSVAEHLLQSKAIKLEPSNPFTWASGWKSPIYCDNRKTLSFPTPLTRITNTNRLRITSFTAI